MAAGESGLLHATTGSGKTYAVWFGALARAAALGRSRASPARERQPPPLGVLWLTPMRALAADSARAMQAPLDELGLAWSVGIRTGDTPSAERAKQDRRFPTALVTTPESLSLMLTREGAREELAGVHTVVVDEWHELMGSKRGVQVQLGAGAPEALASRASSSGACRRRSATSTRRCRCCSATSAASACAAGSRRT